MRCHAWGLQSCQSRAMAGCRGFSLHWSVHRLQSDKLKDLKTCQTPLFEHSHWFLGLQSKSQVKLQAFEDRYLYKTETKWAQSPPRFLQSHISSIESLGRSSCHLASSHLSRRLRFQNQPRTEPSRLCRQQRAMYHWKELDSQSCKPHRLQRQGCRRLSCLSQTQHCWRDCW